jgi:TatA/E family protein of Tat protein translocase
MGIESPTHLLFIAVIALLVLGPKRLPELARAVGKGVREFRGALEDAGLRGSTTAPSAPSPQPAQQALPAPPPALALIHDGPAHPEPGATDRLEPSDRGAAADEPR